MTNRIPDSTPGIDLRTPITTPTTTSTTPTQPNPNPAERPVVGGGTRQAANALLERAGLSSDGVSVRDLGPLQGTRGAEGLTTVNRFYGTSEAQLRPPPVPRIELTQERRQGAESFARNVDTVINRVFVRNGGEVAPQAPFVPTGETRPFADIANFVFFGGKPLLSTSPEGRTELRMPEVNAFLSTPSPRTTTPPPTFLSAALAEASAGVTTNRGQVDPRTGRPLPVDPSSPDTIRRFAQSIETGLLRSVQGGVINGVRDSDVRPFANLSTEALLAAFLKLNINDPNMSVETQNDLHQLCSELRQMSLDAAAKEMANAYKEMEEAQGYADTMGIIGTIITVVVIVLCVVLTVVTFGAGSPVFAAAIPALAGMNAATVTAVKIALAAVIAILQTLNAVMQYKAATKVADAKESQNDAEKSKLLAEIFQKALEEQAAIIKLIMESKNQLLDAVLQMINASFATQNKVMSAGMAR